MRYALLGGFDGDASLIDRVGSIASDTSAEAILLGGYFGNDASDDQVKAIIEKLRDLHGQGVRMVAGRADKALIEVMKTNRTLDEQLCDFIAALETTGLFYDPTENVHFTHSLSPLAAEALPRKHVNKPYLERALLEHTKLVKHTQGPVLFYVSPDEPWVHAIDRAGNFTSYPANEGSVISLNTNAKAAIGIGKLSSGHAALYDVNDRSLGFICPPSN